MSPTPSRPRPGAPVTLHGFWKHANPDDNVIYFRRCTVISFGPKQGAFYDAGGNLRRQINARDYTRVSAGHGPDAAVIAAIVEGEAAHLDSRIAHAETPAGAGSYTSAILVEWKATRDALRAGRYVVRDYADLTAGVRDSRSDSATTVAAAVADHIRENEPTAVGVDATQITGVVQRRLDGTRSKNGLDMQRIATVMGAKLVGPTRTLHGAFGSVAMAAEVQAGSRMDAFLPVVHPVPVSKTFDEVAAPRGGDAPVLAGIALTFQTARAAASFIREFVAREGDNEENVRDLIDTRKWSTDSNETAEIADNVIAEMEHGSEVAAQRWWLDGRQLGDPNAIPRSSDHPVYPIPLNGTIDDHLAAIIEKKRVAIAAVDPNARLIDFHLDEIDRWRSGAKASPGLSPLGDRYALEMREGIKHHEAEIEKLRGRTITGRDRLDGAHQAIYDLFANHPDRVPPLRPVSNGLFPITPKALVMMFPRRQHPEVAPVIHTPPSGTSRALSWENPAQARKLINALLEDKVIEVGERNRAGALVGFLLTASGVTP